jgi:ribosomal protein L24
MQRVKKEDTVLITKGKDRGRTGAVRKVLPPGRKTDKWGRAEPGGVLRASTVKRTCVHVARSNQEALSSESPDRVVERRTGIA